VKEVDARLLRRLSDVSNAIAPVLMLLIEHWNNDLDGGLPPSADLRGVGEDLVALGRDVIARADEVDRIVAGPSAPDRDQPRPASMDGVEDGSAGGR
jgi:hypothetical protein